MALPPILFGVLLYTAGTLSINTLNHVAVREGGTVTIPCLYDYQYKLNSKYWCTGTVWISCKITARANSTGKWTLTDYPAQNLFTVKLNNPSSSDSGYYWCAVEIDGNPNIKEYLYLTVKQDPDVSVMNSRVSGHEGDHVSVQCFYSSRYKNKLKLWCRFKDQRCYGVGRSDTSQNSSVQISDDGRSFTVLMTGLRLSDSGWYFCSAGDREVPVQLLVQRDNEYKNTSDCDMSSDDARPSSNSSVCESHQTARNDTEETLPDQSNGISLLLWTAVPLLLLLMLVLVIWRIIQKHSLPTQGSDVCSVTEDPVSYDTVVFKKGKDKEQNQSCPRDPDEVIYSTVKLY